jgi:hypothetical protein
MSRNNAWIAMAVAAAIFLALHFVFGWDAYQQDAIDLGQSANMADYRIAWARDTLENLQSEFWQLAVQFALLAGVLKWIGLQAHEEDQEKVKQGIGEIKSDVSSLKTSYYKLSYDVQELGKRDRR